MLSFSLSSVNDISSNITSRDYDDDEFLFSAKMRPLSNDKLIHRQSSSFVFVMSESSLRTLGYEEQIAFLVIFSIITSVSLFGNLLTICALIMRKQRFLFKVCLFSLAISDLTFTIASGSHYVIKLHNNATPLWNLGWIGCKLVPFIQTASVLIESMSLILIALDRFLAVRNKSQTKLLQNKFFCLAVIFGVWTLGAGISSPVLFSYEYIDALVIPDDDESDEEPTKAFVCVTDMDESATYYIIVFTFIFIPVFVGFIWLNTIISREIWKRRHAPGIIGNQKQGKSAVMTAAPKKIEVVNGDESKDSSTMEMKNTDETNTTSSSTVRAKVSASSGDSSGVKRTQHTNVVVTNQIPSSSHTERQRRQMRMFKVILILMSVFICCRLPNWIFLLIKLKYDIDGSLNWNLLYTFGALGLLNSMMNPFLYTFLNETIRVTTSIGHECRRFFHRCCRLKCDDSPSNYANNQQTMFAAAANNRRKSDGGIYLGS